MKSTVLSVATLVLAAGMACLSAESINPPTTPQTAPMSKQEKKNLDMVLEWWRVVIQNRHMDAGRQVSGRGLHPAQSQRHHGTRGIHRVLQQIAASPRIPIPVSSRTNPW